MPTKFVAFISGGEAHDLPYKGKIVHAKPQLEYGSHSDPVILILPHGNPDYFPMAAATARKQGRVAIILETGGQLCHLAITANENPGRYVVGILPKAREILAEGTYAIYAPQQNRIVWGK